jgi:hypothetical protein
MASMKRLKLMRLKNFRRRRKGELMEEELMDAKKCRKYGCMASDGGFKDG